MRKTYILFTMYKRLFFAWRGAGSKKSRPPVLWRAPRVRFPCEETMSGERTSHRALATRHFGAMIFGPGMFMGLSPPRCRLARGLAAYFSWVRALNLTDRLALGTIRTDSE